MAKLIVEMLEFIGGSVLAGAIVASALALGGFYSNTPTKTVAPRSLPQATVQASGASDAAAKMRRGNCLPVAEIYERLKGVDAVINTLTTQETSNGGIEGKLSTPEVNPPDRVVVLRKNGHRSGHGVTIAPGYVLTAYHLTVNDVGFFALRAEVSVYDSRQGNFLPAQVASTSFYDGDMSLLRVPLQNGDSSASLQLKSSAINGEKVTLLTTENVEVRPVVAYTGIVTDASHSIPNRYGNYVKTTLTTRPGYSGSPVVTADNKLLGLAVASHKKDLRKEGKNLVGNATILSNASNAVPLLQKEKAYLTGCLE